MGTRRILRKVIPVKQLTLEVMYRYKGQNKMPVQGIYNYRTGTGIQEKRGEKSPGPLRKASQKRQGRYWIVKNREYIRLRKEEREFQKAKWQEQNMELKMWLIWRRRKCCE
jgi:hypothetical protein